MQFAEFLTQKFFQNRKGSVMRILTLIFGENRATIPLLVYKIIVKHQEKETNQFLKEQSMVCSRLTFFNASPFIRANLQWPIYLTNLVKEEQIMVGPFIRANFHVQWPIYLINLVHKTKFSCFTPPQLQYRSFF